MVVRDDGTKWACSSCLKGHRVSGCNHTDRELKLVPKKGRPITQCQHCRQERKKRSAHVKCDCADDKPHHTKEKCIHLREAEERAKSAGFYDGGHHEKDPAHLATVAEEQGCCCHHGGKCSCAMLQRKDSTDDDGLAAPRHKPAVSKPKLETTRSDGSITVFTNGHHKPVHRKNHAAHECGMPYKIPMPRSKTDNDVSLARRSVDSLPLDDNSYRGFPFPDRQTLNDKLSPKFADLLSSAAGLTSNKLNLVDFSNLDQVRTNESAETFPAFDMPEYTPSDGWPSMSVEGQTMPNNNPFGVWPTNADIAGLAQPALTAASSGTQSEIDEIPNIDDMYMHGMPSIDEAANLEFDDAFNAGSPQTNRRSLPPNFFGNLDFSAPNIEDEWQPEESVNMFVEDKAPYIFNDPWQVTQPSTDRKQTSGRPVAHSVGAAATPGNDIIKQLFPGMDVDGSASAPRPSLTEGISPSRAMSDVDQADTFTAAPWSDGSLSVPNDFNTFDADFDNQTFEAQMWNS